MLLQSKVNSKAWKIQALNFLADAGLLYSNISATVTVLRIRHTVTLSAPSWPVTELLVHFYVH
jgi:hypothetical protein